MIAITTNSNPTKIKSMLLPIVICKRNSRVPMQKNVAAMFRAFVNDIIIFIFKVLCNSK
jgi:hypothetical protein